MRDKDNYPIAVGDILEIQFANGLEHAVATKVDTESVYVNYLEEDETGSFVEETRHMLKILNWQKLYREHMPEEKL